MKTHAVVLSLKDWAHERVLSLCGVLALASMLTPLLILHGVHTGVIERLRQHLLQDPAVLVLMPVGARGAGFSEDVLRGIAARPECLFCIGRTRDVAAELHVTANSGASMTLALEATSPGDPILTRHNTDVPQINAKICHMVLTHTAAKRLGVAPGATLRATLARRRENGRLERKEIFLTVSGVLPAAAMGSDMAFVPMPLLLAIQDFRDGLASTLLHVDGETPPEGTRYFESFRAYVRTIDDVAPLETWLNEQHIPVKTRSRDIANIKHMDETLAAIISIIAIASGVGFFAFMASTIHASVRRKWKMLGMLRLIGYSRWSMLVYPVTQALATGILGVCASLAMYNIVSWIIDLFFAAQTEGQSVCFIHVVDMLCIGAGIQLLVFVAALRVSLKASHIDPAAVIREF